MIECSFNNLTKYYGANKLFQNISFDLKTGERVGLIGQNGCGKTTLMKMIMGVEDYQAGSIAIRKDARVGYLNQMPVYEAGATTISVIERAFESVFKLKQEMKALEERLNHLQGVALEKALQSYGRFTEEFESVGGYDIETKISKITAPRCAQSNSRTGKIVLQTEGLAKDFGDKVLLRDVQLDILYQDSVCIVGRNGSGKTTLLKMILGEVTQDSGALKIGSRVKIGYLPQNVVYEDEELTVLEYFTRLHDLTLGDARSQLAKALFMKEDVLKKIKSLSGGEKSRLKLCSLTFAQVNFMILDEPTNHLDIDSREVLEETLIRFDGTLLFVSHDRYFINKVADKMMAIENKGIHVYQGDYSYYLEEHKKGIEIMNVAAPSMGVKENKKKVTFQPPKSKNIARVVELLEAEIDQYERKIKLIEGDMIDCALEANRLNELFQEKVALDKKLEKCLEQWEAYQEE